MKKILLLTTGGTIASTLGEKGLTPTLNGERLLSLIGRVDCEITVKNILELDSSNIQPEEWQFIAESVFNMREGFDGIVITHGTDTMAYTASMLTFMLKNIDIPVVLTGSQLPIETPLSDAPENLRCALAMAESGTPGVFLAFNRKIFLGCRSVKVRTTDFDAFESVNIPPIGTISSHGLVLDERFIKKPSGKPELLNKLENRILLIKLIPGIDPYIFTAIAIMGFKGIVIEAFGSGGLHFVRRDLVSQLENLVKNNIAVVVCSQCLYEQSDMTTYEVGRRALEKGVIPAGDMTSESAVTKMMWGLGQGLSPIELSELFKKNLAGEISEK